MIDVKAYVSREKDGSYSIYVDEKAPINYGLVGEGKTVKEAMDDWNSTYNAMRESYNRKGKQFVEANFTFVYDVPSFLSFYSGLISFKGLSRVTGISAGQLSQYATGYRKPSLKTTAKIQNGLKSIGRELSQVSLL